MHRERQGRLHGARQLGRMESLAGVGTKHQPALEIPVGIQIGVWAGSGGITHHHPQIAVGQAQIIAVAQANDGGAAGPTGRIRRGIPQQQSMQGLHPPGSASLGGQ